MSKVEQDAAVSYAAPATIKISTFDEGSVKKWFILLESTFELYNITLSKVKFSHTLPNLPMSTIKKISDSILMDRDYDSLKDAVISLFEQSKPELFDALMAKTKMLCTKPSVFLQDLKSLGDQLSMSDEFIKVKFLKSLPANIRPAVVTHESDTLEEMAKVADTLLAYQGSSEGSSVLSVTHNSNKQIGPIVNRPQRNVQDDSSLSYTPIGIRPFHPNQKPKVCRFHIFYGPRAKYCKPWCMLSSSSLHMLPNSRPSSRSSSPSHSPSSSPRKQRSEN